MHLCIDVCIIDYHTSLYIYICIYICIQMCIHEPVFLELVSVTMSLGDECIEGPCPVNKTMAYVPRPKTM